MEDQYQHTVNGQSVIQDDLNLISRNAALADDRVLAELLRLTPFNGSTVSRGLIAYGNRASGAASILVPNGASGSILANPFRAIVGSRTAVGSGAKANWRDIRSAIAIGSTTLTQVVSFAANASGNPRFDLVYAAVAVDANGSSLTRKVKDPTSALVTGQTIVREKVTTVTISVQPGTPGALPALPAIPADAGGTYYVPIGYVRIPNGFGASSTVAQRDIFESAPFATIASALGVAALRPASGQSLAGGAGISGAGTSAQNGAMRFNGTAGARAGAFLPPSMVGSESLIVAIDAGGASNANWSHQHNDVVDDSRDWRNRLFRWFAAAGNGGTGAGAFPWFDNTGSQPTMVTPSFAALPGYAGSTNSGAQAFGMGHSIVNNAPIARLAASGAAAQATPAAGFNMPTNVMASGTAIGLYVDLSTGALKVSITGAPLAACIFWLDASGPYSNAA